MITATKRPHVPRRIHPSTTRTARRLGGHLVDLVAVERAVNGDPTPLTGPEQITAARLLTDRGYGPAEIARRIGTTPDVVSAWKARHWPMPQRPTAR